MIDKLPYPMIATPKLDGIRCLTISMGMRVRAVTRSFKPIPNTYIRKSIETLQLYGLDGEITILGAKSFNEVSSAVMSETGEPAFKYWVFDRVHQDPQEPYYRRLQELKYLVSGLSFIAYTPTCLVRNTRELEEIELEYLSSGYEGVILRTPDRPYKFGRSTQKQAWMLKLKRFLTSEAVI